LALRVDRACLSRIVHQLAGHIDLRSCIWLWIKGWIIFILVTILMVIGNTIDNIMMGKKARESGASWLSIGTGYIAASSSVYFLPLSLGWPLRR